MKPTKDEDVMDTVDRLFDLFDGKSPEEVAKLLEEAEELLKEKHDARAKEVE